MMESLLKSLRFFLKWSTYQRISVFHHELNFTQDTPSIYIYIYRYRYNIDIQIRFAAAGVPCSELDGIHCQAWTRSQNLLVEQPNHFNEARNIASSGDTFSMHSTWTPRMPWLSQQSVQIFLNATQIGTYRLQIDKLEESQMCQSSCPEVLSLRMLTLQLCKQKIFDIVPPVAPPASVGACNGSMRGSSGICKKASRPPFHTPYICHKHFVNWWYLDGYIRQFECLLTQRFC